MVETESYYIITSQLVTFVTLCAGFKCPATGQRGEKWYSLQLSYQYKNGIIFFVPRL